MDTLAYTPTLGFLQNLGWMEMLIIMILLLLLFGKKLPEVGRSLGRGIVEFKKGVKGVDDEVERQSTQGYPPVYQQPYAQQYPPPGQLPPPGAYPPPGAPAPMQGQPVSRAERVD